LSVISYIWTIIPRTITNISSRPPPQTHGPGAQYGCQWSR
jgi:hypothetical protein